LARDLCWAGKRGFEIQLSSSNFEILKSFWCFPHFSLDVF